MTRSDKQCPWDWQHLSVLLEGFSAEKKQMLACLCQQHWWHLDKTVPRFKSCFFRFSYLSRQVRLDLFEMQVLHSTLCPPSTSWVIRKDWCRGLTRNCCFTGGLIVLWEQIVYSAVKKHIFISLYYYFIYIVNYNSEFEFRLQTFTKPLKYIYCQKIPFHALVPFQYK